MNQPLSDLFSAIIEGESDTAQLKVEEALQAGIPPEVILNEGMIQAMDEVGRRFEEGDFFVPEMLISARAMKTGMQVLKPLLKQEEVQEKGTVIIGTVKGDLHDIGKNLVAMMLEGAGFEVRDLGTDVSTEAFAREAQKTPGAVVAMSALLTTTMPNMSATIKALEQAGIRDQVRVIVGGAPITEGYAAQIGADGYAPDASRTVGLVRSLVNNYEH